MLEVMIIGLVLSILVLIGGSIKLSKAMKNEDADAKVKVMPVLTVSSWAFKLCLLGSIVLFVLKLLKS